MSTTTVTTSPPKTVRLPSPSGQKDLEPPRIFDVTKLTDERTQTLRHLLEKGHVAVAPLREPSLIFHSHLPHILGSAYGLGASSEQLTKTYENETSQMTKIDEAFVRGDKISKDTWRDFMLQKPYTVAYVDFFDEEVRQRNGDWKKVVEEYLYSGPEPLINGFIGGLGHPFIHLAYAYEYGSKEVATQTLSLGCTDKDPLHKFLDHYPPDNSTYKTTSLAEVLQRVRVDKRFDGFPTQGVTNARNIIEHRLDVLLEHWNAWDVVEPTQQLEQIADLSVLLAISTRYPDQTYDFFYAHIMTVAHALRVLWHFFPEDLHESILRQYALYTILNYTFQGRLEFGMEKIESVELQGRGWDWVVENALNHKWALDSHFFKVVRAPKVFSETWGEKNGFYLKAAVKYVTEFSGWEGFGEGVEGFLPSRDGYRPE